MSARFFFGAVEKRPSVCLKGAARRAHCWYRVNWGRKVFFILFFFTGFVVSSDPQVKNNNNKTNKQQKPNRVTAGALRWCVWELWRVKLIVGSKVWNVKEKKRQNSNQCVCDHTVEPSQQQQQQQQAEHKLRSDFEFYSKLCATSKINLLQLKTH